DVIGRAMQRQEHCGQHQRDGELEPRRDVLLAEAGQQHHHGAGTGEDQQERRPDRRKEGHIEVHGRNSAQPLVICAASLRKLLCKASAMNGSATSMAMKIARIFGTKTRVVSWICVSACNSETATPTTSPTSISGAATSSKVSIASRATSITSGPVICAPFSSLLGLALPLPACGERV